MLDKLIAIQHREGVPDRVMADRLGISRPMWNRMRNGHESLSDAVAVRAAGAWPELTRDLLDRAAAAVSVGTEQANGAGPVPTPSTVEVPRRNTEAA